MVLWIYTFETVPVLPRQLPSADQLHCGQGVTITNTMLGFRHQTVFVLCLALTVLAAVSVVCVTMLFIERQDIDMLQQHATSLQQENTLLRSQLNDYRGRLVTQQEAAD